jgi:hypothetical protein
MLSHCRCRVALATLAGTFITPGGVQRPVYLALDPLKSQARSSRKGRPAMARSRSPEQFMRRCGLAQEAERPAPRLDVSSLLVANLPEIGNPVQGALEVYEGDPAPDRGLVREWPYG